MAKPAKRAAAGKATGITPDLKKQALEALRDPKVQAQIIEHGSAAIGAAKGWLVERPRREGPSIAGRISERVGDRFGHTGLERRASNVRDAVDALTADSDDLTTCLRPVTESLDEVDKLLTVAKNLPFAKRRKAHKRIDDVLDDLESGLFDSVLAGAQTGENSEDPEAGSAQAIDEA
jgi:ribosomal protein L17